MTYDLSDPQSHTYFFDTALGFRSDHAGGRHNR